MTEKTKSLMHFKKRMLALLAAVSLMALTACAAQPPAGSSGSAGQSSSAPAQSGSSSAGSSQEEAAEFTTLSGLKKLLGLTQEELIATIGENTTESVDEGGMAFETPNIRVWFDEATHTKVAQVLIMADDIDLNGLHLGDSLSDFTEVFGEPLSDKDGDAHFAYDDVFLSVVYDTSTEAHETVGVYVLQEDF